MKNARAGRSIRRGYGNEDRPVTKVLWDREATSSAAMSDAGNIEPEPRTLGMERYYDPAYAAAEFDKVFMKHWLLVCREEDIPDIGDRMPLQVGPVSFFVVRTTTGPNKFKGFFNACLHRGTKLCAIKDSVETMRCPYHGWEWDLNGEIRSIPSHWDFTHVNKSNGQLREVKLECWGGFIFINPNPDSVPLVDALGPLPKHFENFDLENRYTKVWFKKSVSANWKLNQEAFQESYHLMETHPGGENSTGDTQAQYDIFSSGSSHVGRQVTPMVHPSMHADQTVSSEDALENFFNLIGSWRYPDEELPKIKRGQDCRAQAAQWLREMQLKYNAADCSQIPDTEMIDAILYFAFPNFAVWLSEALPFFYRFTPHESDPEKSYFEARLLLRKPVGEEPTSAQVVELDENTPIVGNAEAFNVFQQVFEQDMFNMPLVQAGVRSADPERHYTTLGRYQEMIIQHWNNVVDDAIAERNPAHLP